MNTNMHSFSILLTLYRLTRSLKPYQGTGGTRWGTPWTGDQIYHINILYIHTKYYTLYVFGFWEETHQVGG